VTVTVTNCVTDSMERRPATRNELRQTLKPHLRNYAWSFVFALALTVLVGAIASLLRWSAVGALLAPGMLTAAIVFPEGINSHWGKTYLVLAALMNAFFLAWPVLWFGTWIERFRRRE
jgi:hypothetical protein